MKEKVAELIVGLQDLHDDLHNHADLKDKISRSNAVLSAAEKQLATLKADIATQRTINEQLRTNALKTLEKDTYSAQCELRDLNELLSATKAELHDVQNDLAAAHRRLEELAKQIRKDEKSLA